jgi:predicted amidohydrolase
VAAWKSLLVARAIENQCYVAGVNRVGEDPSNSYCGCSRVIDPYGKIIAACEDGAESVAVADVDMDILEAFRQKFPVLNDAD